MASQSEFQGLSPFDEADAAIREAIADLRARRLSLIEDNKATGTVNNIGKTLASLGAEQRKREEYRRKRGEEQTLEQKMAAVVAFIRDLPTSRRRELLEQVAAL
jgi:hypothetical protein